MSDETCIIFISPIPLTLKSFENQVKNGKADIKTHKLLNLYINTIHKGKKV